MALFNEFTNMHFFSLPGLIAVILIIIPNLLFMRKAQETCQFEGVPNGVLEQVHAELRAAPHGLQDSG